MFSLKTLNNLTKEENFHSFCTLFKHSTIHLMLLSFNQALSKTNSTPLIFSTNGGLKKKKQFAYVKTKPQISLAVTA